MFATIIQFNFEDRAPLPPLRGFEMFCESHPTVIIAGCFRALLRSLTSHHFSRLLSKKFLDWIRKPSTIQQNLRF